MYCFHYLISSVDKSHWLLAKIYALVSEAKCVAFSHVVSPIAKVPKENRTQLT